jgi:hypothetical protein
MTTITNRPVTPPITGTTTGSTGTTGTNTTASVLSTQGVTTPTTNTTPIVGNPNASGASSVLQTVKLDGGYTGGSYDYDSYAVAGQNAGNNLFNAANNTAGAQATNGKQGYERGAISVASAQVDDKHFAIDVKTMHAAPYSGPLKGNDDKLSLFIETKIQGKDAQGNPTEIIARLATPLKGPANNIDAWNGQHRFVINYDELNAALKAHHPDLSLFDAKGNFVTGATIAVRAKWDGGHNWGGYGRLGVTDIPAPMKKNNIASVQAGNVASSSVKISADEMPVDLEHVLPSSVQAKFSKPFTAQLDGYTSTNFEPIFNGDKPMKVSTRLERELKGKVDTVERQEAAIVRMQLISAGYEPLVKELRQNLAVELMASAKMKPSEAKAFAAKLHIAPHVEWAQKDASGAYVDSPRFAAYKSDPQKLVDTGLAPNLDEAKKMIEFMGKAGIVFHDPLPLEDIYKGTKSEMQASVIRRVRSNAIAEGVYNVKPGPGKLQSEVDASTAGKPCGLIRARIEASVELKDKKVDRAAIEAYERSDGTPYNIIGQLLEDAGVYVPGNYSRFQLAANTDKTPVSFTMMQERHRFDIEINGMKLDTSIDFVKVEDPPGSGNVATRQIVEMELEHKFIEQKPAAGQGAAQTTTPAGGQTAPTSSGPSLKNSFSDLSGQQKAAAELTEVSLNVPPRFHRLTDLDDKELWATKEQVASNAVTNALIGLLYPNGVSSCEQKGVEMARALGKI